MLTEQCPRASTPLSLATSLLLGSPSQMAEVCQDSSSRGKLYNRSRSQASRDMENHIQLLLHTLVVRYYCHSHERGTGRRNRFRVVARKCKWIVITIISPEIMLYTAGKQWFSASRLCKKLNKLDAQEKNEMPTDSIRPFWCGSETPSRAVRDLK